LRSDQFKGGRVVSDLPLLEPGAEPPHDHETGFGRHDGLGLDDLVVDPFDPESGGFPHDEAMAAELADAGARAAARKRRNRWLLIGGLVVAFVAVASALISWRYLNGPHTALSTPDTVAGLHRVTDADTNTTTDYLRDALAADASLGGAVGAVYADPASADRRVLLFGGTGSISSPGSELDSAFALLNDQSGNVTGIHEVTPGPLGGVLKCGTSNGDGAPISICGWADDGSLALALFPGRSMDEAADLMRQLRTAIEHRG
jgi:hypothetical protein